MIAHTQSPETKANGAVAEAYDALTRTFEEFKSTNDDRLEQIERRMGTDVLTEEKLVRIDRAMDEASRRVDALSLKSRRPVIGGDGQEAPANREHKAAFESYVRGGESDGLKRLEAKSLSAGSGPDGGYLVPTNAEREILRRMSVASPIRAIATVRPVSTATFKKAFSSTGPVAGWSSGTASVAQTNAQQLSDLTFPTFELFAQPAATQSLLDDASVDVERWIAEEVQIAFAEQEGAAFVTGDGVDKPKGFLAVPQVANASWAWGSLGYIPTGAAADFATTNASDCIVNLVYALGADYRANGAFIMNSKTAGAVRKMKDVDGRFMWGDSLQAGEPARLMGYPVLICEDMPDVGANTYPIAFGDFTAGYTIAERPDLRILRDPFSAKPNVLFYANKRVGGDVTDYAAIKLLKVAVS